MDDFLIRILKETEHELLQESSETWETWEPRLFQCFFNARPGQTWANQQNQGFSNVFLISDLGRPGQTCKSPQKHRIEVNACQSMIHGSKLQTICGLVIFNLLSPEGLHAVFNLRSSIQRTIAYNPIETGLHCSVSLRILIRKSYIS